MKDKDKQNSGGAFFNNEKGFSLVEMAVAMTVFVIVIASIYGMLALGRFDRNRASRRSDIMKNARAAIHLIGRDTLNAGFQFHQRGAGVPDDFVANVLGIPADPDTERDILPAIVAGNNINANDLQNNNNTDIISFCYRDTDFFGGDTVELRNSYNASGTPPEVTTLRTKNGHANQVSPFDLLLLENGGSQVLFMPTANVDGNDFEVAPGDPLGLNENYNGSLTNSTILRKCTDTRTENCIEYPANAKKINWISYELKADGTLVRKIYGNNTGQPSDEQVREQPIAYNISDMQFKYVLENGTVSENPAAGVDGIAGTDDDTPENLNLIRQVTVTFKVMATERDEQTGRYDTVTLTSTFSTRNLEYDAG
jgi:prepilin-type N-terminal cleavage/methylation domain-containing protein